MSADLVRQLHPPRLPVEFTQMGWPDLLAGLGLGLLLAALAVTLAAPFLRARPRPVSIAQRLKDSRSLPPNDRLLVVMAAFSQQGGKLPDDLRDALYDRDTGQSGDLADRIEALIPPQTRRPTANRPAVGARQ